ncbi:hypothetical protein NC651_014734 [Populus alba x Populus x berolinensis]|nr:hypothetical protein NC651_014734 [Populus alba x Populus x berolinensis]
MERVDAVEKRYGISWKLSTEWRIRNSRARPSRDGSLLKNVKDFIEYHLKIPRWYFTPKKKSSNLSFNHPIMTSPAAVKYTGSDLYKPRNRKDRKR